ncbi:methyltransferase domain-containing protein [Marinobacter lutaoensis]|uniref:methyltransferase domain-containing protein n=1 Tax=Marinobacter lutaoensis TaxID=135739 RepID=UPI00159356E2|nr:methyltransferase domain-containing protein [Marinobacter lutaoensis]NVD34523.1 methyltransferase domain-containing protein [Marinobacter lutaoensis]
MTELSVSGLKALAYEQFEQGHFAEAAELLEVLESRIGQQASLSNDLAVAYYRKGEHERALARFREAAELQMQAASLLTANLTDMLEGMLGRAGAPASPVNPLPHLSTSFCPLCQASDAGFSPLPDFYRENAERYGFRYFGQGEMTAQRTYFCAGCGASDRERLYAYWLVLALARKQLSRDAAVMHFAPEPGLSRWLRGQGFRHYQTADYAMAGVDYRADLMDLPFDDASLDFFICSHVLEHVRDDRQALAELFRVLRPGGAGILMVPVILGLEAIDEDPDVTGEGERWRRFGQGDHVRLYNRAGYIERIGQAGFELTLLGQDYFGACTFESLGLKPESLLYIVRRPDEGDHTGPEHA